MTKSLLQLALLILICNPKPSASQSPVTSSSVIDPRSQRAFVKLSGADFSCELETDWKAIEPNRAPFPKQCWFNGHFFPDLKFGFNEPWKWIQDLTLGQSEKGTLLISKGFRDILGSRIPFMQIKRFFWADPSMLYEVFESRHVEKNVYVISDGNDSTLFKISSDFSRVTLTQNHTSVQWQFSPNPSRAKFEKNRGWVFEFDSSHAEVLIRWGDKASLSASAFHSISGHLQTIKTISASGNPHMARSFQAGEKQKCIEPDEQLLLPEGEILSNHTNGINEMAVRRVNTNSIELGEVTVFSMDKLAESKSIPDIKPFLVRSLRSLCERRVFNVVLEDDPGQDYLWGTGTWPRCFSISCLDLYGFTSEAYGYAEFMLDASRQFQYKDSLSHLWDSFYMTGQRREVFTDINGHSIKLFEIGKFYERHRTDQWGKKLLGEQYETLREWCLWIEKHTDKDGLILDLTESNVWDYGYGTFTQSPAAAGVKLFADMAKDNNRPEDASHFSNLAAKLTKGLTDHLYGDATNHYLNINSGIGKCYVTYIPDTLLTAEKPLGLSCYSLGANFFLLDPDVRLLSAQDEGIKNTLQLAMANLGDDNDPRIITWHVRKNLAHIGYGQGQLLMSLIYANQPEAFRERLSALFDVSKKMSGDPWLIPEVLGRPQKPNRGNKAHLTYYPLIIAYLAGFSQPDGIQTPFIPDLTVKVRSMPMPQDFTGTYSTPFQASKNSYNLCMDVKNFYIECSGPVKSNGVRQVQRYSGPYEKQSGQLLLKPDYSELQKLGTDPNDSKVIQKQMNAVFKAEVKNEKEFRSIKIQLPETTITLIKKLNVPEYQSIAGTYNVDSSNEHVSETLTLSNAYCGGYDYGDYFCLSESSWGPEGERTSVENFGSYRITGDSIYLYLNSQESYAKSGCCGGAGQPQTWTFEPGLVKGTIRKQNDRICISVNYLIYTRKQ